MWRRIDFFVWANAFHHRRWGFNPTALLQLRICPWLSIFERRISTTQAYSSHTTRMNTPLHFRSTWASLMSIVALSTICLAADETRKITAPVPPHQPYISVDFPGGSLAELNAAIKSSGSMSFNLVGEKSELAAEVPPFSIRNAAPDAFAMALNQVLTARGLNISAAGNMGGPNAVYVVTKARAPRPVNEPVVFESFQLEGNLEKASIDDIVAAIRTAWELNPENKPDALKMKFHPATKLLLVSGTPSALTVARQVVSTLPGPNAAERERRRMQAVAEEVKKRRGEREGAAEPASEQNTKSPPPTKK
jgi:hypothetical protein